MATSPRRGRPARRAYGRRSIPPGGAASDLREAILAATTQLLTDHSFSDLAVSDILTAAQVSRGTFYFYFDSKQAVLAELVRRAVAQGHVAAAPWLARPPDPVDALRTGTAAGARLWQENAAVLRAIVENWRTDSRLTTLWREQMQTFTDAAVAQITADPHAQETLAGHDLAGVA
ncbi:MAG: TetR/AcrR family transcriptional regulator, partial [Actinobacteria bacterium]|nr:TetR/AcrR family transcriptional regulator [Actinomycetota bacterium]